MKIFLLLGMILSLASCAQNKKAFRHQAFFKQSFRGARISSTDMNGNEQLEPVDTLHLLFLKFKKIEGTPSIDSIFIGNKAYRAQGMPISAKEYVIGTTLKNPRQIQLSFSNYYQWWQFQLIPIRGYNKANKSGKIIVKGHWKAHPIQISIAQETELQPDILM